MSERGREMFHHLLLQCIHLLNANRSIASIYHLVKGKRSAQTLQDANLYHLKNYFGVYKPLKRQQFNQEIQNLEQMGLIFKVDRDTYRLTPRGQHQLQKNTSGILSAFRGIKYMKHANLFALRLQLWVQTYTHIVEKDNEFIAITDHSETQRWVKTHYYQFKLVADEWLSGVYNELFQMLSQIDRLYATIFVDRLTGKGKVGLTIEQIAIKHDLTVHDVRLILSATYQHLIYYIIEKKDYSYLRTFLPEISEKTTPFMTDSAQKTYSLIKNGKSIVEIVKLRGLKESTIQDHIVEIAYVHPNAVITKFVDQQAIEDIATAIAQSNNNRLTTIKQNLNDRYSYFEIRLVLASVNQGGN